MKNINLQKVKKGLFLLFGYKYISCSLFTCKIYLG